MMQPDLQYVSVDLIHFGERCVAGGAIGPINLPVSVDLIHFGERCQAGLVKLFSKRRCRSI